MMVALVVAQHNLFTSQQKKEKGMTKLYFLILRLVKDERGQDMVEYALLAGFIAVAAGAILPGISNNISVIFSKMASLVGNAALA